MHTVFHWFYCMPIRDALLLIILATMVFLFLRKGFNSSLCWKVGIPVLLICWIAVILLGTLCQRTIGSNTSQPVLIPFYSYYTALNGGSQELYRANFMNMVLFYPAGLLGYEVLPKFRNRAWRILLLTVMLALMSMGIEWAQYRFGLGLAETDDVIHNILGTFLGALACSSCTKTNQDD